MLLALYLMVLSLVHLLRYASQEDVSFTTAVNHNSVAFGMVIYGALASLYPAALCTYHIFLMARGETTREYLNSHKYPKDQRHRPYNQLNWFKNWMIVLCRPRGPTYVELKEHYRRGDTRFYKMDETGVHKEEWGEEGPDGQGHGSGADRQGENNAEGQRSLTSRIVAS
jgi:palmitoyltransferase ZDHHC9/14/18